MVELEVEEGRYRVWLLEYHREAECRTTRILEPGHFFQGRFRIGGQQKDRCDSYIQPMPPLLNGCYIPEEKEVEIVPKL
ncbi:hypothetical protein Y032_0854g2699 [Ancylostoma ceylanicum]|uniref:Uncharacterized protein n=1 Tax=Ancylostoma ceylanicum TaxID=53326 RepID=A0A016WAZ5_9BILA|nr:hypothetical protein Y032_0854g2699 [Ancylostoma ceylanicum]